MIMSTVMILLYFSVQVNNSKTKHLLILFEDLKFEFNMVRKLTWQEYVIVQYFSGS